MSNSAEHWPVVVWGVILYFIKNLLILVSIEDLSFIRFIAFLNVWTARSASPLDAGWKGAVRNYGSWKTVCSENSTESVNSCGRCGGRHDMNIQPLTMLTVCIHYDQKIVTHKWPSKINVNSGPRFLRPFPRVQTCHRG